MSEALLPRVLIGSSKEGLVIARAIQSALEHDALVTLWTDDVMRLSQSPITSLIPRLQQADFAVIVATADDQSTIRGVQHPVPRDNVTLELGLAIGILGPHRTFLVSPRDVPQFKIASDLLGYEPASFDPTKIRARSDVPGAIAGAVNRVRDAMDLGSEQSRPRLRQWGFFNQLARLTPELVSRATQMDFYFIHSRRWREDNADALRQALKNHDAAVRVYLPDLDTTSLRASLISQFTDGHFVPTFVAEGFNFWRELKEEAKGSVEIYLFQQHPTYTTYRIDDFVLTAMYPATHRKQNVPAFVHDSSDAYWEFISEDLKSMVHAGQVKPKELRRRATLFEA